MATGRILAPKSRWKLYSYEVLQLDYRMNLQVYDDVDVGRIPFNDNYVNRESRVQDLTAKDEAASNSLDTRIYWNPDKRLLAEALDADVMHELLRRWCEGHQRRRARGQTATYVCPVSLWDNLVRCRCVRCIMSMWTGILRRTAALRRATDSAAHGTAQHAWSSYLAMYVGCMLGMPGTQPYVGAPWQQQQQQAAGTGWVCPRQARSADGGARVAVVGRVPCAVCWAGSVRHVGSGQCRTQVLTQVLTAQAAQPSSLSLSLSLSSLALGTRPSALPRCPPLATANATRSLPCRRFSSAPCPANEGAPRCVRALLPQFDTLPPFGSAAVHTAHPPRRFTSPSQRPASPRDMPAWQTRQTPAATRSAR